MTGDEIHVGFAVNFGTSLSAHYVGNSFPIQLADVAGTQPRLTYLSYTQSLFDDRLTVRVGRLTVNSVFGEEFLGSGYFKAFTSVGFDLIPLGLFLNAPGAFGFFDTGLVAYGPLSIRPKDFAALGVVYGSHSARLERATAPAIVAPDFEMTLEWTYGFACQAGLCPSVQFAVHHPSERQASDPERSRYRRKCRDQLLTFCVPAVRLRAESSLRSRGRLGRVKTADAMATSHY